MSIFTPNSIPTAEQSIKKMEELLLALNVSSFIKEYENEELSALYFVIAGEKDLPIRLPLATDKIVDTLNRDYRHINRKAKFDIREKAERIALAELTRYVESISTMVKLGQTTLNHSFLAFSYDQTKDKTFYEMLEEKGMKFLEE
jgi:hypothetical protein